MSSLPHSGAPHAEPTNDDDSGAHRHEGESMADSELGAASTSASTDPQNKPGYRRSYKACDSCRARKIRCDLGDLDAPSDPPCKRCKRERQDCTFTTGVRGNRHGRSGIRANMATSRRRPSEGETSASAAAAAASYHSADATPASFQTALPTSASADYMQPSMASSSGSSSGLAASDMSFPVLHTPMPPMRTSAPDPTAMAAPSSFPSASASHSFRGGAPHSHHTSSSSQLSCPQMSSIAPQDPARSSHQPFRPSVPSNGSSRFGPSVSLQSGLMANPSLTYTYSTSGPRLPPGRLGPASSSGSAPILPPPPFPSPTAPGQSPFAAQGSKQSPAHSASASPAPPHGTSPATSGAQPTHSHPHHTSSSPASSSSPAASADSGRHGGQPQRGRGLKRSNASSSSSLHPVSETGHNSATAMTPSGSSIDRAALAQVNLQNSRDALKLLATLAGGAKHHEDERDRDSHRDRSRDRLPGARERSRDRLRDRSRDRVRDRSRDRGRDHSRDRFRDRSRDRFRGDRSRDPSRERSSLGPSASANAAPSQATAMEPVIGSVSGPEQTRLPSNGRTSLSLGTVHRMQRPSAATTPILTPTGGSSSSPQLAFRFAPPNAANDQHAQDAPRHPAEARLAAELNAESSRLVASSAPATPRGESGPPRFGSMATRYTIGLHVRDRSRDPGPSLRREEEIDGDSASDFSDDDLLWPRKLYSRQTTPQPPSRLFTLADFEPVRLKILKRGEVKMLVEYYYEHVHSFAPRCSEHYAAWTPEVISELVEREPILLGAILSIASRYCHSGATNIWPDDQQPSRGRSTTTRTSSGTSGHPSPVSWRTHLEIGSWTHAKVGRALFDPTLHTIGTVEALLMLSEWSTIDIDAADMMDAPKVPERDFGNEDDEDEESMSDGSDDDSTEGLNEAAIDPGGGAQLAAAGESATAGTKRKRQGNSGERRKRRVRRRTNFLPKAHLFDAMAWQLISMAARMAEALDIHNEASYYGLDSASPESRRNAERRLNIWMRVVHCDTQLSIRLGRRGMTDGALTPAWLEVLRSHAFHVLESGRVKLRAPTGIADARISPRRSKILAEALQRAKEQNLVHAEDIEERDNMSAWVETRAFAELMETVAHARDMIHLKSSTTEAILLDDKFEVTLRCIRTSLEAWARWVSARVGNTMGALRLRLEYHELRLYAYGPALDALVQRISRVRSARSAAQANDMLSANENLIIHPAYPFAVEAVGAAQTMIRMLTSEIESLRCAPARYFLLIVYASLFLLKASAASSVLLPLPRCLASVQAVINTLLVAGPDRTHLCRRYALLLRKYAKQFIKLEVEDNTSKLHTPVVGGPEGFGGSAGGGASAPVATSLADDAGTMDGIQARDLSLQGSSSAAQQSQLQNSALLAQAAGGAVVPTSESWTSAAPSASFTPVLASLYPTLGATAGHGGTASGLGNGDVLTAFDWMWDDMVNPNFGTGNDVVDVDDFLQWLDTAAGAPNSGGSALSGNLAMNFDVDPGRQTVSDSSLTTRQISGVEGFPSLSSVVDQSAQRTFPTQSGPNLTGASSQLLLVTPTSHQAPTGSQATSTDLGTSVNRGHASANGPDFGGSTARMDGSFAMPPPMSGYGPTALQPSAVTASMDVDVAGPDGSGGLLPGGGGNAQSLGLGDGQGVEGGGDLRKLTSGWFASVMGSINRMS